MVRARDRMVGLKAGPSLQERVARIRAVNDAEVRVIIGAEIAEFHHHLAQIRAVKEAEMGVAIDQVLPPRGTPITMNRAAVKYRISQPTVGNWVRYGFLTVLKPGKGQGSATYVDEYDVAKIIATQDVGQGKRTKPPG